MKKQFRIPLRKKDPLLEKIHFFFLWFVRFTLLIALYRAIISENWYVLGIILFALLLTFLAFFIERRYKIDIPIEFEIFIALLIYCSIFLGELKGYYTSFWWWDLILHTLTGVTVGPNPLRPSRTPGQKFTFRNLPADGRVRIYTYLGELLYETRADASGMAVWDGRNKANNAVASGLYLALVQGSGGKKMIKLVIER